MSVNDIFVAACEVLEESNKKRGVTSRPREESMYLMRKSLDEFKKAMYSGSDNGDSEKNEDIKTLKYDNLYIEKSHHDTLMKSIYESLSNYWLDVAPDGKIVGAGISKEDFKFPNSYGKYCVLMIL